MKAAAPVLSALFLLLGGCFQPPVPTVEPPRIRPALGRWERSGEKTWRHRGGNEGVLLLPWRPPLRLEVEILPGPGCRAAGILAGYKGPRDTQAVLAFPPPRCRAAYIRWEDSGRIAPPTAVLPLEEARWKEGFRLALEVRRDSLRASLEGAGPGMTWLPPLPLLGKIALYADGPARFVLSGKGPAPAPPPPPDPSRIWSRFARPSPGGAGRAAARLVERSLSVLRRFKRLSPREGVPAWFWTGEPLFREALAAWAAERPPLSSTPRQEALRLLDLLALWSCQPGKQAARTRERLQEVALGLAGSRKAGGLWEGADKDPLGNWILPGRALLASLPRLRGAGRNRAFQAWRTAMNRMVEAFLPGKEGPPRARGWSTRVLLEAGLFLAESTSRRAALSTTLNTLERLLEERRLVEEKDGLSLVERDGKTDPFLDLLWARLLPSLGRGAVKEGYREAARRVAARAAGRMEGRPLPFSLLRDLFRRVPELAPPGTLAILDSTGRVLSILKDGTTLSWTTAGPSTETVLTAFPRLVSKEEGEVRTFRGPLLEILHEKTRVVLHTAPDPGSRKPPSSPRGSMR